MIGVGADIRNVYAEDVLVQLSIYILHINVCATTCCVGADNIKIGAVTCFVDITMSDGADLVDVNADASDA